MIEVIWMEAERSRSALVRHTTGPVDQVEPVGPSGVTSSSDTRRPNQCAWLSGCVARCIGERDQVVIDAALNRPLRLLPPTRVTAGAFVTDGDSRPWYFGISCERCATFVPVAFSDLPGWADDDHLAALKAFRTSCSKVVARSGKSG